MKTLMIRLYTALNNAWYHTKNSKLSAQLIFIASGVLATVWFLSRVIPKPSRAHYPCVKAAAPIASGFVIYLLSLSGSAFLFQRVRTAIRTRRYMIALTMASVMVMFLGISLVSNINKTYGEVISPDKFMVTANEPIGEAKGYMPGRVTWIHDPRATNENMSNTAGDYWYESDNANQEIIDQMMEEGILQLADTNDAAVAWDLLIRHFNQEKGRGDKGYQEGEKIMIKLNLTNSGQGDSENVLKRMDASPQVVLALLKQLVEVVGVKQQDITVGDPFRFYRDHYIDLFTQHYPDIDYIDGTPTDLSPSAVRQTEITPDDQLFFSDGRYTSRLPQAYLDADYFINMPCLKTHNEAGITITAKMHQGSYLQSGGKASNQSAFDMHYSYSYGSQSEVQDYGAYRHLVDYMGHEYLGGNTLLNIVDGMWYGHNWEGHIHKWQMAPFNGDYPSSLLFSQDQVATDAVCYDLLLAEYDLIGSSDSRNGQLYPYYNACDDYLIQAADPAQWADGITYDPEDDGTPLESLGVYEHWDSPSSRKYSRNLETGDGIELVYVNGENDGYTNGQVQVGIFDHGAPKHNTKVIAAPNPFTGHVTFQLPERNDYQVFIYDLQGKILYQSEIYSRKMFKLNANDLSGIRQGTYIYSFRTKDQINYTGKMNYIRK